MSKEKRILQATQLSAVAADVEGLAQHEMVALVSIAESLDSPGAADTVYEIRAVHGRGQASLGSPARLVYLRY